MKINRRSWPIAYKALACAIHNMSVLKRNTKLKERLNPSLAVKTDIPVITPKVIPYPKLPEAPCSIAAEDAVPYKNKG